MPPAALLLAALVAAPSSSPASPPAEDTGASTWTDAPPASPPATGASTATAASPAPPSDAPPGSASSPSAVLIVRARGLDEHRLQAALRPRADDGQVVLLRDVARVDPDHTFIDVDLQPPELTIRIILRDGRVFVRRAAADGPRDAARLIASMLAAIADDALAPLPERATSPALEPSEHVPSDMPRAPSSDLPLAVPVPPVEPAPPAPVEDDPPEAPPPPDVQPEQPEPPAPRLHLDLAVAGGPQFGLGLPDPGVRGGGGELRLDLRGSRIWLVSAGVRLAGQRGATREEQFGLVRVRARVGAGAWLRQGRFDLRATANFTVEPWFVTHEGRRVRPGESASPAPLLGGLIHIAPSFAVATWFHLGLFAELSASAAPTGNAVHISGEGRPLFDLGGPELALGVELRAHLRPSRVRRR